MPAPRCSRLRRASFAALFAGAALGASVDASAQDGRTIELARDAFDQGTAAYRRREYAQAADYFARADELVPSDEALEAALDSATRADDGVLAMRLVDRSLRTPSPSKGLAEARRVAQERFRQRTGRIVVRCTGDCTATLDGKPVVVGVPAWTLSGKHAVAATSSGNARDAASVEVKPSVLAEVTLTPRSPASQSRPERATPEVAEKRGVSPAWVWVGAGAAALFGGAATVSGIQTLGKSDDFEAAGCSERGSDACDRIAESGRSAQLRTNLFLGGAALAATATLVLGLFVVDWRTRPPKTAVSAPIELAVAPGFAGLRGAWR